MPSKLLPGPFLRALIVLWLAAPTALAQFPPFLCGDCAESGGINVNDALRAAHYSLHPEELDPWVMNRCDVDTDGDVDITDALMMAQEAVGLPTIACPDQRVRIEFDYLYAQLLSPAGGDPLCAGICDVDTDGDGDAIVSVALGTGVYRNDTSIPSQPNLGTATGAEFSFPAGWWTFRFVDYDHDNDHDLVAVGHPDHGINRVELHRNMDRELGPGHPITFVDESGLLPGGLTVGARDLDLGDVDGDGDLDLVVARGPDAVTPMRDLLLLRDAGGQFNLAPAGFFPARIAVTSNVDLVDLDGDADLDLVVGFVGDSLDVYLGDGAGHFTATSQTPFPWFPSMLPARSTVEVVVADLDRDQRPDVFATASDRGAELWRNTGNAFLFVNYYAGTTIPPRPSRPRNSTLAEDLNGDGLPDLLIPASTFRLFLNLGHLDFYPDQPWGFSPNPTTTFAGDLNRDQRLDLIFAGPGAMVPALTRLLRP